MSSIPLPALSARIPEQPDLLGKAGQAMQLRNLGQQSQIQQQTLAKGQQELAGGALALQQQQQDAADQQTIRKLYMANNGDLAKTIDAAAKSGIAPKTVDALRSAHLKMQADIAGKSKTDLENLKVQAEAVGASAAAVVNAPAEQKDAIYAQERARLIQGGIPVEQIPEQRPPDDVLQVHATAAMSSKEQYDLELSRKEKAEADADKARLRAVEEARVAQETVNAAETKRHNLATEAIAAKAASLKQPPAGAVANVQPNLVAKAVDDSTKAGQDAAKAVQAADDMKSFTQLARSGNKIAYAYAPVEGVLTLNTSRGVTRVNMSEIGAYGGSGSALDHVMGFLGKQTTGASIPANILNDMDTLHQQIASNAQQAYKNKLKVINKNYGSTFEPVDFGGSSTPSAPATPSGATHIGVGSVDKKKHYLDANGKDLGLAE